MAARYRRLIVAVGRPGAANCQLAGRLPAAAFMLNEARSRAPAGAPGQGGPGRRRARPTGRSLAARQVIIMIMVGGGALTSRGAETRAICARPAKLSARQLARLVGGGWPAARHQEPGTHSTRMSFTRTTSDDCACPLVLARWSAALAGWPGWLAGLAGRRAGWPREHLAGGLARAHNGPGASAMIN